MSTHSNRCYKQFHRCLGSYLLVRKGELETDAASKVELLQMGACRAGTAAPTHRAYTAICFFMRAGKLSLTSGARPSVPPLALHKGRGDRACAT
jgi:hypothetical protein